MIDGSYECSVQSPLGEQKSILTIKVEGDRFSGSNNGAAATAEITGKVDGNVLTWSQNVTAPMPMTLDMRVTIDGDAVVGTVGAGAFGSFPMTGARIEST